MIVQVVCVAVLLMVTVSTVATHRLLVERDRQWAAVWTRAQAQALAQGGLMWALARLEDPRSLDGHCRVAATGPGNLRFAEMAERGAARMACDVGDLAGGAPSITPWSCQCDQIAAGAGAGAAVPASASAADATAPWRIEWTFEVINDQLKLVVSARWVGPGSGAGTGREQVLLRRDGNSVWRMVVGSWWDDRN